MEVDLKWEARSLLEVGEFGGSNFLALGGGLQTEPLAALCPSLLKNRISQQVKWGCGDTCLPPVFTPGCLPLEALSPAQSCKTWNLFTFHKML